MTDAEDHNHRTSDSPTERTYESSDDYGFKDYSLSENYVPVTRGSVLTPLLIGERISFETSLPTTSTVFDTEEPFSYAFLMSSPYHSNAHDAALSNAERSKYTSYSSIPSTGVTPQASSVKSHHFLSSLSNSIVMSIENDYQHGRKCSNLQTLMNTYKGNSGTGILSLPLAFKYGGLWVGLFCFLLVAASTVHAMHILSRGVEYIEERLDVEVNSYHETVEVVFEVCAPHRLRKYSTLMRNFVSFLIVVMQSGFSCVYVVFVATNIKEVLDQLWEGSPCIAVYELMVFICLLPYLMIKSLKTLAAFSSIANIVFIAGLVICFQYILKDLPSASQLPAFSSFTSLPLLLGNVLFSFEGISLVVPLRRKMKEPEAFGGSAGVLSLAMAVHTALCAAMGFYGYLKFGNDTASTVTLNLPQDNNLYRCVDLMFAIVIYLSTAVQFYVPANHVWSLVERRLKSRKPSLTYRSTSDWRTALSEILTRFFLIFTILLVALLVPHVDLLISLIGALMGSFLALIIPGMIEIILRHFQGNLTFACVVKDVALIALGLGTLVTGTYASINEIVKTY